MPDTVRIISILQILPKGLEVLQIHSYKILFVASCRSPFCPNTYWLSTINKEREEMCLISD